MQVLFRFKILLMLQVVSLITICIPNNVSADSSSPVITIGDSNTAAEEDILKEDDYENNKVIAFIYSDAAMELGDNLLDAEFASSYFGLAIVEVDDLTTPYYWNPNGEGCLLLLSLAEDQNASDAIKVLKEHPKVEYTQMDGLIDYIGDFKSGRIYVTLKSEIVVEMGESFVDVEFTSSFLGLDITKVKTYLTLNRLDLTLEEDSKQSVMDAIALLEKNPNVESALPFYISYLGVEPNF